MGVTLGFSGLTVAQTVGERIVAVGEALVALGVALRDAERPVTGDAGELTVELLAARLHRSPSTARGWLERGLFPGAYKLPGDPRHAAWRIPPDALATFIESRRNGKRDRGQLGDWRKVKRP